MALRMHFYNCISLRAPVPGLIVYLGIYVELIQEILNVTFVLDVQKSRLEVFNEIYLIFDISLACWLIDSSADWWFTCPLTVIFWPVAYPLALSRALFLEPPILFSTLGFFFHPPLLDLP